jgi:hypothetical protein
MQWVCVGYRKQIEAVLARYGPVNVVYLPVNRKCNQLNYLTTVG